MKRRVAVLVLVAPAAFALLGHGSAARPVRTLVCAKSGRVLYADVNGDTRRDRVWLTSNATARGCRFWLNTAGRFGSATLRLHEGLLDAPNVDPVARVADLFGFARIDRHAGAEILVVLDRGAASSGMAVYTYRNRRLRHLPLDHRRYSDGLFWEASSGGYTQVVDCWPRAATGNVLSSYEGRTAGWLSVDRTLYVVRAGRFVRVWHRSYPRTRRRFPEFSRAGTAFRSCRAGSARVGR